MAPQTTINNKVQSTETYMRQEEQRSGKERNGSGDYTDYNLTDI